MQVLIEPAFFLGLALALLLVPVQWVIAWILAATVHELSHLLALHLLHVPVCGLTLSLGGARLHTVLPDNRSAFFAALAGPAGSLLLLLISRWLPATAVCGLMHGAFNLLPVMPLDGGRAARALLCHLFPKGDYYAGILENITVALCMAGCIYLGLRWGCFLYTVPICWLLLRKTGKIPCKPGRQRVQ